MTKKAGKSTTTIDEVEKSLIVMSAKKQYIGAAMNMGWQLALTVLVPVFVGVQLDTKFDTEPSYTLAALILAACGAGAVVYSTIKDIGKRTMKIKGRK